MAGADQMQKHSQYSIVEEITAPSEQAEFVRLTLLLDVSLTIQGSVSGKTYKFSGAGAIQDVDIQDANGLLEKRYGGRQCCGSGEVGNRVFHIEE